MFCMYCGQELPDGARFCMKCSTQQGQVSPTNDSKNVYIPNKENLLKRIEMLLEDGDFDGVKAKCDYMLDYDPTYGKMYFYMLLADLKCQWPGELKELRKSFEDNPYYIRAMQFCDEAEKWELKDNLRTLKRRMLNDPRKGEIIYFGVHFMGTSRMAFKVLDVTDTDALIFATKLDIQNFLNKVGGETDWESCSIRNCFSDMKEHYAYEERMRIIGEFSLLTVEEAQRYFSSDQERALGASWWLRPSEEHFSKAPYVDENGAIITDGDPIETVKCIMPVMRIKIHYNPYNDPNFDWTKAEQLHMNSGIRKIK